MKKRKFTLLLLFWFSHFFAQQKGLSPTLKSVSENAGDTYALVVGISDYQDESIPDLRFADKDAEAFAAFLKSETGGQLDSDHLKVLINENATAAHFAIALDWLWEVVKENDKVIIYFSGHGDVENKSITQPGYLLCWDSPPKVYMAGGALNVRDLSDVISTLSLQNKAKVILVTDACRAGKLSGSNIGGSQATATNLAKQFSNEIKILSCQPDEFSLEGEQWGGGRGAFSYHLLNGLYGLADFNGDHLVSLMEIRSYLEQNVTIEVEPESQIPMVIGNGREILTEVSSKILIQLKENQQEQLQIFAYADSKGIEDSILEVADSSIIKMYQEFQFALKSKHFFGPINDCADYYYEKLEKEPSLNKLHSKIRRNYAAALQDEAQQVINSWLKLDLSKTNSDDFIDRGGRYPTKSFTDKINSFPKYLDRAAELLGKNHYLYSTLKARKCFFEGYLIANSNKNLNEELGLRALNHFYESLDWEENQPHVYWQISGVFANNFLLPDSMEHYASKAINAHPNWIIPYVDLAWLLSVKYKDFVKAKLYLDKAMQIDPNSSAIWLSLGVYYKFKKEYHLAQECNYKALEIDPENIIAYNNTGNVYRIMGQYEEAEKYLSKAILLDSSYALAHYNLGTVYTDLKKLKEAEEKLNTAISLDSTIAYFYNELGDILYQNLQYSKAKENYLKSILLEPNKSTAYLGLGNALYYLGEIEEAEKKYITAFKIDSCNVDIVYSLGSLYTRLNKYDKAEKFLLRSILIDSTYSLAYDALGFIYMNIKEFNKAENNLKKAIKLNPSYKNAYYNYACLNSLQSNLDLGFINLRNAIINGYDNYDWMQKDSDLQFLRDQTIKWNNLMKEYFQDN